MSYDPSGPGLPPEAPVEEPEQRGTWPAHLRPARPVTEAEYQRWVREGLEKKRKRLTAFGGET